MEHHVMESKKTPIKGFFDVIVVGGSQSGVAAAVCAAREGANVLLVEKNSFLGGQGITSLVLQWEKNAFTSWRGDRITRGIASEMLERVKEKAIHDALWDTPPLDRHVDGDAWLDAEAIKIVLLEMCLESGVELLFGSILIDVECKENETGNRTVNGVIVQNRSGLEYYQARVVIDATAFLEVVWHAMGDDGVVTAPIDDRMSPGWFTEFRGIDSKQFLEYIRSEQPCTGYPPLKNEPKLHEHFNQGKLLIYHGFPDILDRAYDESILEKWPEERMPLPFKLTVKSWNHPPIITDRWCTVLDLGTKDVLNAQALSQTDIDRQVIDWILLDVFRLMPGWGNAYISRTSIQLGHRDTRRLKAITMVTREDVFHPDVNRQDAIGLSDGHDAGRNRLHAPYPIPYGILVPEKLDGVLCCSRAVGVADRTALDAHRGITPTIVVGQAAGTAAALVIKHDIQPREANIKALRNILKINGVLLNMKDD